MSNSTTLLDTISAGQSGKEITANDLFDAGSPATLFGRRASTTSGLTWGYYGGVVSVGGVLEQLPNGTVTLTNSATNYIEWDDTSSPTGVVKNTSGWTPGLTRLYKVVTSAGAVASYEDWRTGTAGDVSTSAAAVSIADSGAYYSGSTVEAALQEIGADLAALSGTDADTDLKFTSDTGSTADSDPGNGLFKWNHATQGSATVLYFDNQTQDAVASNTFFASLGASGFIHIVQNDDATKWQKWKWTATPTAGAGYYKFTVTLQANGGSIVDDKQCSVRFDNSGSAGGGIAPDVQTFTADGTWTKPAGCTLVRVVCIGGGAGGGGGVGGSAGTVRAGGTGGGGGSRHERIFLASEITSPVTVTIGLGGTFGTGGSAGVGTDGALGGNTTFGSYLTAYGGGKGAAGAVGAGRSGGAGAGTMAAGGAGGATAAVGGFPQSVTTAGTSAFGGGGGNGITTGAAPGCSEFGGGAGGGSSSAGTGGNGGGSVYAGGGGAAGGGVGSGNVSVAGGDGGSNTVASAGGGAGGGNTGVAGTAGATPSTTHYSGQGGGGGGGNASGTGGAGGAGAIPGGGGGGGGGGTTTGGAGAAGARGECRVYAW